MKNKSRLILLVFMFSVTIFLVIPFTTVKASSDIDYSFESEVFYDYPTHQWYSNATEDNFNLKINTLVNYSEVYNATYSFTGENGLTGTAISFIDSETSFDGGSEVIGYLDGHNETLAWSDDPTAGEDPLFIHDFTQSTSGLIEFWLRTSDATNPYFGLNFFEGVTIIERWRIQSDLIDYTDTNPAWVNIDSFLANKWYHFKFEWRSDNTYDMYLDGAIRLNNLNLEANQVAGIDNFKITSSGDSNSILYFDAYGETWQDYYTESENIIPLYENITLDNQFEVDRYEFAWNDVLDDLYDVGYDEPSGWQETEPAGDSINIAEHVGFGSDRVVYFDDTDADDERFYKTFDVLDGMINITFGIEFDDLPSALEDFDVKIYSSDATVIAWLEFSNDDLKWKYSAGSVTIFDLGIGEYYEFNWFINPNSTIDILHYSIDGVDQPTEYFPSYNIKKNGLSKVEFGIDQSGISIFQAGLDYVGVYVNGSSISDELAWVRLKNLGWSGLTWYLNEHNLITFEGYGNFSLWIGEAIWLPELAPVYLLTDLYFVNNTNHTFNIYGKTYSSYNFAELPSLWFQLYDEFNISDIIINGIRLTDGVTDYPLIPSSSGVDESNSYFYVQGSSLYWTMTMNDNNTEYIQANFDIPDFSDDNYSMYLYGYEYSNGYGYYGVNYADSTSAIFSIPSTSSTTNNYLNKQRDIIQIVILITDKDDYYTGVNTGYIKEISFRYISNADLTLATLTLTNVMLNLIVILIPSLLFWYAFDKKRDVLLISIILMLIVSFATSLIPMWLFFLGLMCMGMFFFIKTDEVSF